MPGQITQKYKRKIKPILYFCGAFFIIGFIAALLYAHTWQAAMIAIEWILACMISGCFLGFLFGIPKVVQNTADSSAPPAGSTTTKEDQNEGYRSLVNTNLSEISDWLTKIIVGIGLIQLTKIPPFLKHIATALAQGMGMSRNCAQNCDLSSAMAFAYGIIIGYFIIGFIFTYLMMRLYLAVEMVKADQQTLIKKLEDRLNTTLSKVDNLDAGQSLLTKTVFQNTEPNIAPAQDKLDTLKNMADQYMSVNAADYSERVSQKESVANNMASYALQNQLSKDDILAFYDASPNEALLITLATMILTNPETKDFERLMKNAYHVTRKHIQFRILNALSKLITLKFIKPDDLNKITPLLDQYRASADTSLNQKINSVASLIKNYKTGSL